MLVAFVAQTSVAQEGKLPPTEEDMKTIEVAIHSKDFEKLKEYASYNIPKVDSTLAIGMKDTQELRKCIYMHNMKWPLEYLDLGKEMAIGYFPDKLYRSAFYIPTDGAMRYKMLEYTYERCDSAAIGGDKGSLDFWRYIQGLDQRSPMAAFSMLVMAQTFGQSGLAYGDSLVAGMKDITAIYLNTWGGEQAVENFNKWLGDFLTISADGSVSLKFNPAKSATHDEACDNTCEQVVALYEKLARLIHQSALNERVDIVVEQMPEFPGGDQVLMKFLSANVKYPTQAAENNIQGRVVVGFLVERDGSITNVQVLRSAHPLLDAEAVRVVKSMPKWKPGKQNGDPVRVLYQVPVAFRLGR